ncbi:SMP-30/gluconolactonase/LRE family protein [Pseudomonas sp. PS01302]|uniref:SMP-30/gluconolactonase/LRE family protein n=1 Tax=Pseudomonas sp. PS01302 TaxID=2991438 RepID=UPI00249CBE94|nr:SMP-30/gluconolactonase/LRE family protein [Pseudomonas sp. PS01302]
MIPAPQSQAVPKIEIIAALSNKLGESPIWDVRTERLYWVDGVSGIIYRSTAQGTELMSWQLPSRIGSIALRKTGGVIVALKDGLYGFDFDSQALTLLIDPEPDLPGNCLNDGKVDREGRFVFGSMDQAELSPSGSLYRFDPDHSLHCLDIGFICSNGPCWSPDGRTLYFQDSYAGEICAYDYALDGNVSKKRVFARVQTESGAADGSTVDAEGYLWNAQVFDGLLVRYAPDGTIDRRVEMPLRKVTSVMFGGADLDMLFVTSMGTQLQPHFPADGELRGSLLVVKGLGVRGLAEHYFSG